MLPQPGCEGGHLLSFFWREWSYDWGPNGSEAALHVAQPKSPFLCGRVDGDVDALAVQRACGVEHCDHRFAAESPEASFIRQEHRAARGIERNGDLATPLQSIWRGRSSKEELARDHLRREGMSGVFGRLATKDRLTIRQREHPQTLLGLSPKRARGDKN